MYTDAMAVRRPYLTGIRELAQTHGEIISGEAGAWYRSRPSIGRYDRVQNLSTEETAPAVQGRPSGGVAEPLTGILQHKALAARTFHCLTALLEEGNSDL